MVTPFYQEKVKRTTIWYIGIYSLNISICKVSTQLCWSICPARRPNWRLLRYYASGGNRIRPPTLCHLLAQQLDAPAVRLYRYLWYPLMGRCSSVCRKSKKAEKKDSIYSLRTERVPYWKCCVAQTSEEVFAQGVSVLFIFLVRPWKVSTNLIFPLVSGNTSTLSAKLIALANCLQCKNTRSSPSRQMLPML